MQDFKNGLWPIKPHTKVKLKILKAYLSAWFPILLSKNQEVVYVDGFAGPGQYKGGEDGSPIVALKIADEIIADTSRQAHFIFIESKHLHCEILDQLINNLSFRGNISYEIHEGQFEDEIQPYIDKWKSLGTQRSPIFLFIDPFGPTGIQFSTIRALLEFQKSELFINFDNDGADRLLASEINKSRQHVVSLMGTEDVLVIRSHGQEGINALRSIYHQQLRTIAEYVRFFQMRDKNHNPIYDLFFATNHPLGFLKMKEAMWKVDPEGTFSFSDANDPNQLTIFEEDHTQRVAEILRSEFKGKAKVTGRQIREFVEFKTFYLGRHKTAALRWLEKQEFIIVDQLKIDRKTKRRSGYFTDDSFITFI